MKTIKPEQIEAKKQRILDAALDIIKKDGIDGLSIRKISGNIRQTPGIIYHYYQDKDAILEAIVKDGYQDILKTIASASKQTLSPTDKLLHTLRAYIYSMLDKADIFLILMHSKNPRITTQINVLAKDIRQSRKSIDLLCKTLEEGIFEGAFQCSHVERRAQCIWCSIYGLLERLLQEQIVGEQRDKLIQEELNFILDSIAIHHTT